MRGKRRIIPILLILSLICCSCGMEENAAGTVESEQTAEEPTEESAIVENIIAENTAVEDLTIEEPKEISAFRETEEIPTIEEEGELPAIVFLLHIQFKGIRDEDINKAQSLNSFIDNQGNLYFAVGSYFNGMKYKEIYDEFVDGKLDEYLTLETTCDLDELRENYELLKSVAKNKELKLVPDRYVSPDGHPDIVGNTYIWSAFYYDEERKLSRIKFRYASNHPFDVIDRVDDERADQVYEWLASLSKRWK
ncbi:MAG: hypothetical protein NC092_09385 [Butyrivibrio sp.]|nr:hypothetical protein [Muribaculum sp.]MCM1552888.1 hypothetical protein [Butyrivibrio sp.]